MDDGGNAVTIQKRPKMTNVVAAVLLLALPGISGCLNPGKGKTAYVGATVIDGTGAPPILDGVIIVADGRIEQIGPPDLVKVHAGHSRCAWTGVG